MTERVGADSAGISRAAAVLCAGGLVAFPTETVYGLGARADRSEAVRAIFTAKGRPPKNPLIVHVADVEEARALCATWTERAEALARAFWPGALTLVLERRPGSVADEVTAGGPTVAVRIPAHPVARAILERCRLPIAAPSANRSTSISPTLADHVEKTLSGRIDLLVDGGPTGAGAGYGIESTIVDVTTPTMRILRKGALPLSVLAEHGRLVDGAGRTLSADEPAMAPGGHAKHYAPDADLSVVPAADLPRALQTARAMRRAVGVLVLGAIPAELAGVEGLLALGLPPDPAGYAAGLYAALHAFDDAGCEVIVVSAPPETAEWDAVADRLRRAGAGKNN